MQPNQVKGASMEPNLHTGDYILTSKITYRFRPIARGDVVVFKSPKNPDIDYIKRVIGLPGDQFLIENGNIYVNNQLLEEPYTESGTFIAEGWFFQEGVPFIVPNDQIVAFGDNRPRSSDSREFGPVPIESIIGQVFYRYYPPPKMGPLENPVPKSLR